jgi:hypothetical protein
MMAGAGSALLQQLRKRPSVLSMDFASVAAAPSTAGSTVSAWCDTAAGFDHAAFVLGAAPRALLIAQVDLHSGDVIGRGIDHV